MEPTEVDHPTRTADIESIKRVVASVEHATQNELVDEFLGLFRADAIWTTGGGQLLFGHDEIAAFTREVLPGGMKGLTITMEVTHILFIRADVAAVKVRQVYASNQRAKAEALGFAGQPNEAEGEGTPLFIMAKEDARWLLVACQNTGVLDA
ncbi:MAG TPA: SgcJ/EcaC family oxidoreductase [Ilumatobacteraceae bacterium]|nr:SgcJ/EcaC family oxidoreductase [Ilumatobacteraceae bacterium]